MGESPSLLAALTCDDAPTILRYDEGMRPDPSHMDRVREILQEHGVPHCVAFVTGKAAQGHESQIVCWLEAGYQIGNHTFDHIAASSVTPDAFLENVVRCHTFLESLDAFGRGVPRLFRFPYLDRGATPEARQRIQKGLASLGYAEAHGSVDLYDHHFEGPLARALARDDHRMAREIQNRFVEAATASLIYRSSLTRSRFCRDVIQIPYFHFGPIAAMALGSVLEKLVARGVHWRTLPEALSDPVYQQYNTDLRKTGLVTDHFLPGSAVARGRRRIARLSHKLGLFNQSHCGPCWPHLG